MTLRDRIIALEKSKTILKETLVNTAREAMVAAVEKATAMTPPNDEKARGVNVVTGALAQSWSDSSKIQPTVKGSIIETELNNNMQYASYVNDGHRMDRHFVHGLYIGEDGLISYDPAKDVGMMVGTKTKYVPGIHMTDYARDEYHRVLTMELAKVGAVLE